MVKSNLYFGNSPEEEVAIIRYCRARLLEVARIADPNCDLVPSVIDHGKLMFSVLIEGRNSGMSVSVSEKLMEEAKRKVRKTKLYRYSWIALACVLTLVFLIVGLHCCSEKEGKPGAWKEQIWTP